MYFLKVLHALSSVNLSVWEFWCVFMIFLFLLTNLCCWCCFSFFFNWRIRFTMLFSFCYTAWILCTCISLPSQSTPHPIPLGHQRAPSWAPWATQQIPTSYLLWYDFSSCGRNLVYIHELKRRWPFETPLCSAKSGLLCSYEGHLRNLN